MINLAPFGETEFWSEHSTIGSAAVTGFALKRVGIDCGVDLGRSGVICGVGHSTVGG